MKLWLIKPKPEKDFPLIIDEITGRGKRDYPYWGYDTFQGFVIRADTADRARNIIIEKRMVGGEGKTAWTEKYSTCEEIPQEGEEEIILDSFNAG